MQQNSHVVLALDNTDKGSDVIVIEGKAELITDPDVNSTIAAYSEKYASELKSMGWTAEVMAQDFSQGIRITPTKLVNVV